MSRIVVAVVSQMLIIVLPIYLTWDPKRPPVVLYSVLVIVSVAVLASVFAENYLPLKKLINARKITLDYLIGSSISSIFSENSRDVKCNIMVPRRRWLRKVLTIAYRHNMEPSDPDYNLVLAPRVGLAGEAFASRRFLCEPNMARFQEPARTSANLTPAQRDMTRHLACVACYPIFEKHYNPSTGLFEPPAGRDPKVIAVLNFHTANAALASYFTPEVLEEKMATLSEICSMYF